MKDEFDFIEMVKPSHHNQASLILGIGDDAAVYESTPKLREVICVDTMIEGVHFTKDTLSAFQIGRKALAINVSDLAAMGAIPRFYLVSIAIPPEWNDQELADLYVGMEKLARTFNMDLIGGDTVSAKDSLVISVTAVGQVEDHVELYRSQAEAGDAVFVTGYVGTSAAGLELLLKEGLNGSFNEGERQLVQIHQEPNPQIKAGRLCAEMSTRISLNDISDGVASEAHEIAAASDVTLTLFADSIPYHPAMQSVYSNEQKRLEFACNGGEDFQLIGTIAKQNLQTLIKKGKEAGVQICHIGEVQPKAEHLVYIQRDNKTEPLKKDGFNHFR